MTLEEVEEELFPVADRLGKSKVKGNYQGRGRDPGTSAAFVDPPPSL